MVNPGKTFKAAFVVPRYGEEVVGGAEDLARRTAEELAARGCQVSALTTCALDHHSWRNHYPPGGSELNGVEVLRFPAITRLGEADLGRALAKIAAGKPASEEEQRAWLEGVVTSPQMLDHIEKHAGSYSHLIFLPYLFGTTYFGSRVAPDRSYIIPCLHDEPYAYQSLILGMLGDVRGLIFNSAGERALAARLLDENDPGPVVGMGFRPHPADPAAFFNRTDVRGDFLLYAGRREQGKNTPMLVEYFERFVAESGLHVSLVLMGAGEVRVPYTARRFITDLGRVSEQEKWDGYSAAFAFCQPSVNESFSIVLLESWLAGRPALVNRRCDVTREHARSSGGGLTFSSYPEFAESLLFLLEDRDRAAALGAAGRRYVQREYNWDAVVGRLFDALGVAR